MSWIRPDNFVKGKYTIHQSFEEILSQIKKEIKKGNKKIAIEFYPLTNKTFIIEQLINNIEEDLVVDTKDYFISPADMKKTIRYNLTEDRIFGVMSHHQLKDFVNKKQLEKTKQRIENQTGVSVVYGVGASLVEHQDLIIYIDLPRREVQKRYQSGKYGNWNTDNAGEDPQRMEKQGYFFEWNLADNHKRNLFASIDYIMDLVDESVPKMMSFQEYYNAMKEVASQPFSLVPYFAPGIWGGKWIQQKFGIYLDEPNLAWSFHGVPEENSFLISLNSVEFETPANNLLFLFGEEILGKRVFGRFGNNFPIRFNLLDTWGGQNLSLQVHPKVDYAQRVFGAPYTQDESYYVLDAAEDSVIYLGLNDGIDKNKMISDLRNSEKGNNVFNDEKYIYRKNIQKHDHYLIPAGTIHSSGKNAVILEISATPNRFTFKLWDWGRVDLDGQPRPISLKHGEANIDFYKNEYFVSEELANKFKIINSGDGWIEEKTGLHETEFIETRRVQFTKNINYETHGSVNVISLVEGEKIIITSPNDSFEPYIATYAQVVIVPECVGLYSIEPYENSSTKNHIVIIAYVR